MEPGHVGRVEPSFQPVEPAEGVAAAMEPGHVGRVEAAGGVVVTA